ncbi:hypothetical protein, partial [Clostridium sp.]|uniref:HNH endonuclease n=1 Tax=Clostridium sp. TaxID=1506 RepID=UPI0025BC0317
YNNQGLKMTIISYRNNNDIDIQFEDGTIIYNKSYGNFKKGNIKYPIENKIGETNINNQGLKMTIISYKKYSDIDVQFEDGTIVEHMNCSNFKTGRIKNPNYNQYDCRINENIISCEGYKSTIINYINSRNCTVSINVNINGKEYNIIKYNIEYKTFKKGLFRLGIFNIDNTTYKRCPKCKAIKELNDNNFYISKDDCSSWCIECCHEYYKENPQYYINSIARRREVIDNGEITKEQWLEMMNFFDWKCAYSGIQLTRDNRSSDHVIPITNNGKHEICNLVPMFVNYNSSKNNKDMLEWYLQQPFFSIERLTKIYEWRIYAYWKWNK